MSRKWSPAADRARDALFDQLLFSGLGAAERWQLINDLAHALAQQQRDFADDAHASGPPDELSYEEMQGAKWAADLIDPSVGPVRPGEEPTT
jgi:hypothetical protein